MGKSREKQSENYAVKLIFLLTGILWDAFSAFAFDSKVHFMVLFDSCAFILE